jgi:ribosomal-protein-serine acetyltransferase
VTTLAPPMFVFALSDTEALVPRTRLMLQAYHDLLASNHERLARWEPWAVQPVLDDTRAFLDASARNWIADSELPVAIAVCL